MRNKIYRSAKRILTGVLSAAMILTAVPSYAFAAEIDGDIEIPVYAGDETEVEDALAGEEILTEIQEAGVEIVGEEYVEETDEGEEDALAEGSTAGTSTEMPFYVDFDGGKAIWKEYSSTSYTDGIVCVEGEDDDEDEYFIAYQDGGALPTALKISVKARPPYKLIAVTAKMEDIELTVTPSDNVYSINAPEGGFTGAVTVQIETEDLPCYKINFLSDSGVFERCNVEVNGRTITEDDNPVALFDDKYAATVSITGKPSSNLPETGYTVLGAHIYNGDVADHKHESTFTLTADNYNPVTHEALIQNVLYNTPFEATITGDDAKEFKMTITGTETNNSYDNDTLVGTSDVKITIGKAAGSKIDVNGYKFEAKLETTPVEVKDNVVTIPKDLLLGYIDFSPNINLELDIISTAKTMTLKADGDNKIKLHTFDPKTLEQGNAIGDDGIKNLAYGTSGICVVPEEDPYYKVKQIKIKETNAVLTKKTVGTGDAKKEYYEIPAAQMKQNDTVTLVVVPDYVPEDSAVSFTVEEEDGVTVAVQKAKYDQNEDIWTLPAKTGSFTFTVETKGNKIITGDDLILKAWDVDEETYYEADDPQFTISAPKINSAKDGLVFTVTAMAKQFVPTQAGASVHYNKLEVKTTEADRKLFVGFGDGSTTGEFTVTHNGDEVPKDGGLYDLSSYDPFDTFVITAKTTNAYKLTNKGWINDNPVSAAKATITTTAGPYAHVDDDDDALVFATFDVEPIPALVYDSGLYFNNDTIPGLVANDLAVDLKYGAADMTVKNVAFTPATAVSDKDAFVDWNLNKIDIDYDMLKDASKPVKFTVTGESDNKTQRISFSVNFKAALREVNIKGMNSKNRELTQVSGTTVDYTVTVNAHAPQKDLRAVLDESCAGYAWVELNETCDVLTVDTGVVGEDGKYHVSTAPVKINFTNGEDGPVINGQSIVINPVTPRLIAPTASIVNVSDVDMVLSVAMPRGIEATTYKNLYYRIKATAVAAKGKTVAEGMLEETEEFILPLDDQYIEAGAYTLRLTEDEEAEKGRGKEQKYNVEVSLVQYSVTDEHGPAEGAEVVSAATKTLTASTRNPSYEVKMNVTKKTTTFFKGEKNVLVGVAKFSAGTSFTQIDEANSYVQDAEGNKLDGVSVKAGADGISLYLPQTSGIPVGKATVVVKPNLPANTVCTPATIPLTVKQPIEGMYLTPYDNAGTLYLFKPAGKAGTLKFTVHFLGDTKPASAKVKWSLSTESYSKVKEYVSVKNGTVTVDKALIMGDWSEASRRVTIAAMADDFEGNTVIATRTFVVTGENLQKDGSMVLYDKERNPVEDTDAVHPDAIATLSSVENVTSGYVVICDSTNTRMQPENFTYKVAPKGLTIDKDTGRFTSTPKSGTYTVTATGKDPAKTEYKLTFTVAETTPAYECRVETPTREILTPKENNTDESGNTAITFRAQDPFSHFTFLLHRSDRSILDNTRVKVTGGKTLTEQKDAYGTRVFVIQPTTDPVVIQYEKTTVKVYNRLPEQTITIEPLPDLYANAKNAVYGFKVKTDTGERMHAPQVYESNVKFDHILFTEGEQLYKYKKDADKLNYRMMMVWLNNNRVDTDPSAEVYDGSFTSTISSSPFPDVPAGTYTYTATLVTTDYQSMSFGTGGMGGFGQTKVTYHSAPTTFSIKVKKGKAATAKIDPKVKMTLEADKWSGEISFKKSDFASISAVTLYNCNEKGVVVPLTSFFDAEISEDEKKIVLLQKKDDEFDPAAYPETISGYIEYELVKGDGETNPDMTKVKRTEKFTMTFQ